MSRRNGSGPLPPGPRHPRRLQALGLSTRPGPFLDRCHTRFGDAFTVRLPNQPRRVVISHPDTVEQVFKGDPRVYRAGVANEPLRPVMGDKSVFLLDGAEHLEQRRLVLPFFHGRRVERYGDLVTELTAAEVGRWPVGETFQLFPRMGALTREIIIRAIFGVRQAERLEELRDLIARQRYGSVKEVLLDEVERRRGDPDLAERDDVIATLLQARHEDGRPMPGEEVRDQLLTLLMAGHETAATALAWAIERLVRHPDKLARLRAERTAEGEAYLDSVVKETLRVRPVVPFVSRQLTEPVELVGRLLPAGVQVMPCVYLVHRRADVYPEPRRFLPERFLDRPAGTYTWIPFGGGVRRCLGAGFAMFEIKRILAAIVDRAELRPVRPEPEPMQWGTVTLTLRPARGAEVIMPSGPAG